MSDGGDAHHFQCFNLTSDTHHPELGGNGGDRAHDDDTAGDERGNLPKHDHRHHSSQAIGAREGTDAADAFDDSERTDPET